MVLSQSWISLVVRLTSLKWFQRARHTAVSPRPNLKLHRGTLTSKELPVSMRAPVYSLYSKIFGANISEASEKDVRSYPSLASFFRRRLRPGARPIHKLADMVSPVDGRVLHFGQVKPDGSIEQVKGVKFNVDQFIGPDFDQLREVMKEKAAEFYGKREQQAQEAPSPAKPENKLFFITIYLAPGDYHGVHSPVDWNILEARHFPGDLFSVSPIAARYIKGLFALNERVCMNGCWQHGLFSLTAVGAYNVGSVSLEFDPEMETNVSGQQYSEREYQDIKPAKGDCVAFFNFGSTVVMVFEAPDFVFHVHPRQRVIMGQVMGEVRVSRRRVEEESDALA